MSRAFNFSAGPAALPLEVLEQLGMPIVVDTSHPMREPIER